MSLHVRVLRAPESWPFAAFTFPAYQGTLAAAGDSTIALGLMSHDEPVGLALGVTAPGDATLGQALSILVTRGHRGRGAGRRLLTAFEHEIARRGCLRVAGSVSGSDDRSLAVERLLAGAGWQFSGPSSVLCHAAQETIIGAPWLANARLPPDMEMFSWLELGDAERAEMLDRERRESWIPELLSPFWNEPLIAGCSVGLRYRGRVAGWCVMYRFEGDTVRWWRLFVEPELQKRGRAIPLLAETIRRAPSHGFHHGVWSISAGNAAMMRLLERRMRPFLISAKPVWVVTKTLRVDPLEVRLTDGCAAC